MCSYADAISNGNDAYALGLWSAHGYWWSSSIGLSNVEAELVCRFGTYLSNQLPPERLRLRVYEVDGQKPDAAVIALARHVSIRPGCKMKRTPYHVYVNSRPLLRRFVALRNSCAFESPRLLGAYFAGRFDGDGSWGSTPRIAYGNECEAERDPVLLAEAGVVATSVYHYRRAAEFCLYVHVRDRDRFRELMAAESWKLRAESDNSRKSNCSRAQTLLIPETSEEPRQQEADRHDE